MWVTCSEREWRRKEASTALTQAAWRAEARIRCAEVAIRGLQADSAGRSALSAAGLCDLGLGRSRRTGRSSRADGLAVLESVVVGRVVGSILKKPDLVRWMSLHRPSLLLMLHASTEIE